MRTDSLPAGYDRHRSHRSLLSEARLRFDVTACLPMRYPGHECGLCASACPISAIDIGAWAPMPDGECIGCGQCVVACPSAALQVEGFDLPACNPGGAEVEIDCWRVSLAESARGALRVPCLAGIDAGWLLALFDRVATPEERRIRLLDRGGCATCPVGAGMATLTAALADTRALLAESGVSDAVLPRLTLRPANLPLAPSIPTSADALPVDRRGFFRGLMGGMPRGGEDIVVDGAAEEPMRHAAGVLSRIAARHGREMSSEVLDRWSAPVCADCGEPFSGAASDLCPACFRKVKLQQGMAALFGPSA